MSEGSKAKNEIQNRTELDELSSIIERKTEELDILSKKCLGAESEVESLKGSYTALTALSDQRVGQLEGEKQSLTARLASEVDKVSSMREQVRVLEEQVADKEVQYQQAKQASAALQRVNDQANMKAQAQSQSRMLPQTERSRKENVEVEVDEDGEGDNDGYGELHTLRKQASLDEVHRAHEKEIKILTNKLLLAQDAAASAQSLLLSSKSSGNHNHEEEYSDLVVKYNNLSSELSSEKFSGAAKDVKISLLQDEKEKLKIHAGNVDTLQVKIMKMEQEIVKRNSLLLTKETELLYLNGQIENSDTSSKKTILELNQLNSSLSERMALAAARVKDLSNQIKNLIEEKVSIENQSEESSKLCEELKIELNIERKKSPKVNQLEVERDTLLKTVSHSGTTIRDLEKKVSTVTAEFEIMKSAFLGTERGPAALDAKEKQVALMIKVDQLTVKSAELLASHSLLNEKDRTQISAFAALQAKHKSCLEELEAAAVRHRVTSSEAAEMKNKEHSALQNIINSERNQHQKVLSSLHEVLKGKEKEITTLKANKIEHEHRTSTSVSSPTAPLVPPPPPPPMIQPPPLHLSGGSAGFAALSVIVGQQQTSVQRLTEKLESAESLIFALTQALPGSKLTQDPDSFRSPPRGSGATSSVNSHRKEGVARVEAEVDAESDADSGGGGESERKTTASTAGHYKFNKMHSPAFTSPDNDKRKGQKEKGKERERASKIEKDRVHERGIEIEGGTELEKDLLLTPDQTSMSENENKLKEATRQWKTFINPAIAESWSKVPSRQHDPQPHTKSPMRSRPQRTKEKEKEKERVGSELGLEMWALKVARENRFLEDLTATLKEEKLSVRREQENLGRRRAKWRVKKASNPGDILGKMELREESAELNTHTTRLNAAVEQTRVMQGFLIERRRKLDALKDSLQQLSDCRDALGVSTRIKGSSAQPHTDDADLTLEAMHRLGRELDSEVEVTLHQFNCASSADETSGRARGRPSSSSYPPTGDSDYVRYPRSNHDGKPVSQGGLYQQSNQNQSTKPRPKQQQQQQQQSSSGHPQHGMRGFYSPQGPGPNPGLFDPRMYPFGYDQGPSYQMQPQTGPAYSIPDNAFIQQQGQQQQQQQQQQQDIGREGYYIPPHSSPLPRSHEDPGRWTLPPSTIRFNMGVQGLPGDFPSSSLSSMYTYPYTDLRHSTPHTDRAPVRDPRAIREQIKDLTKRRAQSTEAYDKHARYVTLCVLSLIPNCNIIFSFFLLLFSFLHFSLLFYTHSWLNNLQAEIGQFSHGSGARARATATAVKREDNIPSFTDFMASQCPPDSVGAKHLANAAAEVENEAKKL